MTRMGEAAGRKQQAAVCKPGQADRKHQAADRKPFLLVPMRQLSQGVFWTCISSWIMKRVDTTDWAKQQNTCVAGSTGGRQRKNVSHVALLHSRCHDA